MSTANATTKKVALRSYAARAIAAPAPWRVISLEVRVCKKKRTEG